MSKPVPFHSLKEHHSILIDASSAYPLSYDWIIEYLSSKPDKRGRFKGGWGDSLQKRWALNLLAKMVVYDIIAIDSIALKSLNIQSLPFSDIIQGVDIPQEEYMRVSAEMKPFLEKYGSANHYHWFNKDIFDDGFDKYYHDELFKDCLLSPASSYLANSGPSPMRTIFYLELAKICGIPLSLNPWKEKWFKSFAKHVRPEIFKLIQVKLDKIMLKEAKKLIDKTYDLSYIFPFPPVVEAITKVARDKNISLIESVHTVRDSKPAKDFRRWLFSLQRLVISNPVSGLRKASKEIEKVSEMVKDWEKRGDTKINRNYKIRTLKLKAFPTIGWIFDLMDMNEIKVKDPILTSPPSYINFIASWYE